MRDVIIVGGGPAGLSAALLLGRCRRNVLLCDAGKPRNATAPRTWGLLTRDGTPPSEVRALARADLARYPTLELRDVEVLEARRRDGAFEVTLADGRREQARRLLLATGLASHLPEVAGFAELWGTGVHTCPYCDGYEVRDRPLVAYGRGHGGCGMALELLCWSASVTLCTDGPDPAMTEGDRARLAANGVRLVEDAVERLEGEGTTPVRLHLRGGETLPCSGVFLAPAPCGPSPLIDQLGCELDARGVVPTGDYETTNVPGLFVAGDASRRVQFASVAAAEGAMAAFAINAELLAEATRKS